MRAKRSKKYRKLMHQYELTFGFREPYQVLGMAHRGAWMRTHANRVEQWTRISSRMSILSRWI